MADMSLEKARIHAGIWEGVLTAPVDAAPALQVMHQAQEVPGIEVTALDGQPGQFNVRVPIPGRAAGRRHPDLRHSGQSDRADAGQFRDCHGRAASSGHPG